MATVRSCGPAATVAHCAVLTQLHMLHLQAAGLDVELPDDSRQLRNQFNFSERAVQTFNYPMRDRATFTEPAPTATIAGTGLHAPLPSCVLHCSHRTPTDICM